VVLIVAALATLSRRGTSYGAAVVSAVLLLWVALLHVPALVAAPNKGGAWTGAFEAFALSGAALLLWGLTAHGPGSDRARSSLAVRATTIGRVMYGISMPVFGILHFLYIPYIVYVTPSWIPAHVFFAYATGVAHVASGLSLLSGVLSRIAAYCTAAMFGSWVLIVHAPRVLGSSHIPSEWTSMLIALGMCGGALLIASALANISSEATPAAESRRFAPRATITP
jgi:uncharacterized membrane protein YphA (DoxX/SURF4 family)